MARLNQSTPSVRTHEGAVAHRGTALDQLRRSVMSCMLWENEFYESGQTIADRIVDLVGKVTGPEAAQVALDARSKMHLRHVPLLICIAMIKHGRGSDAPIEGVIQRPDELTEILAIFAKLNGRKLNELKPLPNSLKRGIAEAFTKFNEYSLAKYDRDGAIKLRDALFLSHAKPADTAQAELFKRLIDGKMATPNTWETSLSGGDKAKTLGEKRARWEELLTENKLGAMALLRNLRNMAEAAVTTKLVVDALDAANVERVLPFRFIAAARHAPQLENAIENALFRKLASQETRLEGSTAIAIDCSASMNSPVSGRSQISRFDAACGVAMLVRELCDDVRVIAFGETTAEVPARRGFALRDAVQTTRVGHSTFIGKAVKHCQSLSPDRIIVLTDDQSWDKVPQPGRKGYMINVASAQHGVDHGAWHGISGWSESIVDYIQALEA